MFLTQKIYLNINIKINLSVHNWNRGAEIFIKKKINNNNNKKIIIIIKKKNKKK